MKTLIGIVLDRSGSMQAIKNDVIGGFNSFIEQQKKEKLNQYVTLVQFDDVYDVLFTALPMSEVAPRDDTNYVPRNSTALLDAMGRTIQLLERAYHEVKNTPHAYDRVLMVTITDGQENASREFTRQQIFDLISQYRRTGIWEFTFLAANQDAIATGASYGIGAAQSLSWAPTPEGVRQAFNSASVSTRSYSSGGSAKVSDA